MRLAARAPRGEIRRYDTGHFDIYLGQDFEAAVTDQLAFLARTSGAKPQVSALTWGFGSSDWTRTSNPSINSRMLCRLSYGGPSRPERRAPGRETRYNTRPTAFPLGVGQDGSPDDVGEENVRW